MYKAGNAKRHMSIIPALGSQRHTHTQIHRQIDTNTHTEHIDIYIDIQIHTHTDKPTYTHT